MRFLLVLFFLVPFQGLGQVLENTLLWRISTPGGPSSYLYGTVHSTDDRAFQFGDSVLPALARCEIAAGELDLSQGEQGIALLKRMWMPDDQELKDLYKKKEWKRVDAALTARLGIAAPMLHRVKPFFVLAMLTEVSMEGDRPEVLDEYLQIRARDDGRRVIGIETVEEQLAAMDDIPLKVQATMLLDHVDHDGYPGELDAMLDAYARQDLEGLMEAAGNNGVMPEAMERSLLTTRNTRMVQRMDGLLRSGQSVFFMIGAAHLPGESGLIAGLRAMGHRVDPVFSAVRDPDPAVEER